MSIAIKTTALYPLGQAIWSLVFYFCRLHQWFMNSKRSQISGKMEKRKPLTNWGHPFISWPLILVASSMPCLCWHRNWLPLCLTGAALFSLLLRKYLDRYCIMELLFFPCYWPHSICFVHLIFITVNFIFQFLSMFMVLLNLSDREHKLIISNKQLNYYLAIMK